MSHHRLRSAMTAAILLAGGVAVSAPAAQAAGVTQQVSGTVATTLGISLPTAASFGNLAAGGTASSSGGTITLVSTSLGWTLSVKDAGAGAGKMRAAATGCSNSPAQLSNPLKVTVAPALAIGTVSSAGQVSMSGSDQTVATGSGILGVTLFNTNYAQAVDPTEALEAGCQYSLTSTFTLQ